MLVLCLTMLWSSATLLSGAGPAAAAPGASRLRAITPCRLADVRDGTGFERIDGQIVRVIVAGRCGVPLDATAVALTVTVDNTAVPGPGHVTIWPEGQPIPTASILNYGERQVRANGAIIAVGAGGAIDLLALNGAPVILDVTGWFEAATTSTSGRFVPIGPVRAYDTRELPRQRPLAAGETLRVALPAGVPPDATAVAMTLTLTESPGPGFLTATPAGAALPLASALNADGRGQTRATGTIVGVTPDGIDVFSLAGGHVVIDITGWFTGATAPDTSDGLFVPAAAPRRLLDTRNGDPVWARSEVETVGIGDGASALALNVTIVNPLAPGFITAHPARQPLPPTSSVNSIVPGEVAAAMAIVPASTAGVGYYASDGADVVVDLAGHFVGPPGVAPGPAPTNIRPPTCTSNTNPSGLNALFQGGQLFTGADYQRPVALPDGRVLWLFQDAYVSGRYGRSQLVHNAGLVQSGNCFTLLQSGNYARPAEYLFAGQTQYQRRWFWPLGSDLGADGLFRVFVAEMRENGDNYLAKTEPLATWIVTIDPSTLAVIDQRLAPNPSNALYGWSVASSDNYTYLYAHCHRQFGWSAFPFVSPPVYVHDLTCSSKVTVGRVPKGRFDLAPNYWNGSAWVADPASAVSIVPSDRFASASMFYRVNGTWVSITKVGDWFGDRIVIDVASRPQGPYTTVRTIMTPAKCDSCNSYFASLLPYRSSNGNWILGLSNNVFGPPDLSRYDPSFFTTPAI